MQCPRCNTQVPESSRFCPSCGQNMTDAVPGPSFPQPQQVLCPRCSASVPSSARFCPKCGQPVSMGSSAGGVAVTYPGQPGFTPLPGVAGGLSSLQSEGQSLAGSLGSMATLQVVTLVFQILCFIPLISLIYLILLLILLIKSLSLTTRTAAYFTSVNRHDWSSLVMEIRGKCKCLLWFLGLCIVIPIALVIVAAVLGRTGVGNTAVSAVAAIGAIPVLLAVLYCNYCQIFCFFSLYPVKNAVNSSLAGTSPFPEISSTPRIAAMIITGISGALMVLALVAALFSR